MANLVSLTPLMQPVDYQGQPYYTSQYFHQQYLANSETQGKHRRLDNFMRLLRGIEAYHLYLAQGDIVILAWQEAKVLPSKTESVRDFNILQSMFQATGYQPLTLLNATAQVALSHHLDDELSKQLSVSANTMVARQSAPPLPPPPVPQLPSPQETLGTLYQCRAALQDLGCFDDRDTITFAAYVRCVAATAMQPLLPANAAEAPGLDPSQPVVWTMSMRLQYLRYPLLTGAEGESKKIRIGSLAKKTYEATYNEVPPKLWDFVKGQQRQVNGYTPERIHVLDQAIESILGAPRLQVVAPS